MDQVYSALLDPHGASLASINVVTLHQARLVSGWVTVFGQVNNISTEPGTQVFSGWAFPLWVGSYRIVSMTGRAWLAP